MTMPTALFAGDICQDTTFVLSHVPAPDEKLHVDAFVEAPGGVACNAAVACARAGSKVRLLARLGDDGASHVLKRAIADAGIEAELRSVPGFATRVVILVEAHGEKRLLLAPGVSMYPDEHQVLSTRLDDVRWLHTAPYGAAAGILVERCRRAGIPWSMDLEPATFSSGLDAIAELVRGAAAIFCNDRAAAALGTSPAETLLAMGAQAVILTLGSQGVRYRDGEGADVAVRPPRAALVRDTTGAGDCLAGWYVAGRMEGRSSLAALQRAVSAATLSCETLGAQASFPSPALLENFLARESADNTHGGPA